MGEASERLERRTEDKIPPPRAEAAEAKRAASDDGRDGYAGPVGQPLDARTRSAMESRFGHDFSRVRIHSGPEVDRSADAIGARAFTAGDDIAFASGRYSPSSSEGAGLLTHELTHVVQGRARGVDPSRLPPFSESTDAAAEVEAEGAASAAPDRPLSVAEGPSALVHGSWLGGALGALAGAAAGALIGLAAGPVGAIVGGIVGAVVGGVVGAVATRGPAAPPAFRTERTAYGTFLVYPDDYSGRLPIPDRTSEEGWPVRESVFRRIQEVITGISEGSSSIVIEGDDAFRTSVLLDIAWLLTSEMGRELVAAIAATGQTLTIESTSGGNTTSYDPDADSWEAEDGTPGPGADITIGYNTEEWNPYGGDEDWMRRPPAIGLAHEMVHAWTGMTGTRARGETEGVRRRELQATGLGEFAAARFTENRFREAFGMPLRPTY